jgi:hypothetical protein
MILNCGILKAHFFLQKMVMIIFVYSNMTCTSFFCFVDKRAIYRWYNLIRTCAHSTVFTRMKLNILKAIYSLNLTLTNLIREGFN